MIIHIIIYILILILYSSHNPNYIIEHWGIKDWVRDFVNNTVNSVKTTITTPITREINRVENLIGDKIHDIVGTVVDSINEVVDGIKHEVHRVEGKISHEINRIKEGIEHEVNRVTGVLTKKFNGIGNLFKHLKNIMHDLKILIHEGFVLLEKLIEEVIIIGELLYLVLKKLQLCSTGAHEIYNESKLKIGTIIAKGKQIQTNIKSCSSLVKINLFKLKNKEYRDEFKKKYQSCLNVLELSSDEITNIIEDIIRIMKNKNLFALDTTQKKNGKVIGETYRFCKDRRKSSSGKFDEYSKKCNQCFNMHGILAMATEEIINIRSLIPIAKIVIARVHHLFDQFKAIEKDMEDIGIIPFADEIRNKKKAKDRQDKILALARQNYERGDHNAFAKAARGESPYNIR